MIIRSNTFRASPAARRIMTVSLTTYSEASSLREYVIEENAITGFVCHDTIACIYIYVTHTYYTGSSSWLQERGLQFQQNEIDSCEGPNLVTWFADNGGHNVSSNGMSFFVCACVRCDVM